MNGAERQIRREIGASGAIPFSRFMELALYAPEGGYYSVADRRIGRGGDFQTSVSVGEVFGFLLAWVVAEWAEGGDGPYDVVEAGAHDGQLAWDILASLQRFHPGVFERVRYRILEPLDGRRQVQAQRLALWGGRVAWVGAVEELGVVDGLFFSNELLDAFPVERYEWDRGAGRWWESGVGIEGTGFGWRRLEPRAGFEPPPAEIEPYLPEGFVMERAPGAEAWWGEAAGAMRSGRLAAFDYGFLEASLLRPERPSGTLRGYSRHRLVDDLLAQPGAQDLTAHVDFPRIAAVGEARGLSTECLRAQGRWLGWAASRCFEGGGEAAVWLQARAGQVRTLIHPGHFGHSFSVLVQRRESPQMSPRHSEIHRCRG